MSNIGVLFVEVNVTLQKACRHFVLLLFMDNNNCQFSPFFVLFLGVYKVIHM